MLMKLILLAALALQAFGAGTYTVTQDGTATTSKVTVQVKSNVRARIRGLSAYIYCAVACEAYMERGGTTATTTAVTPTATNANDDVAVSVGYTASNAGAGTKVGPSVVLAAAQSTVLDLTSVEVTTGQQFTVIVTGSSGRQVVSVQYVER